MGDARTNLNECDNDTITESETSLCLSLSISLSDTHTHSSSAVAHIYSLLVIYQHSVAVCFNCTVAIFHKSRGMIFSSYLYGYVDSS